MPSALQHTLNDLVKTAEGGSIEQKSTSATLSNSTVLERCPRVCTPACVPGQRHLEPSRPVTLTLPPGTSTVPPPLDLAWLLLHSARLHLHFQSQVDIPVYRYWRQMPPVMAHCGDQTISCLNYGGILSVGDQSEVSLLFVLRN
jgi:hypothetical protein